MNEKILNTGDVTSDGPSTDSHGATTANPDSGPPGGTSTGIITTFFTTGDSADLTGFESFGTDGPECDQTFKATIRD